MLRHFFLVRASVSNRSDLCTRTLQVTKKPKKEKKVKEEEIVVSVDELSPIAHPLAHRKLLKKLNKAVKNGGSSLIFF